MKKVALITTVGITMILVLLGFVSKNMNQGDSTTLELEQMPNFYLSQMDSSQVALHNISHENELIITLINSECQICHSQVDEFYKRAKKLGDVKIILVSYQNIEDIKEFAKNYPNPPFTFWKADFEMLNTQFEDMGTPQTRVYNSNRELIKKVDGITRVVHIKKYLEEASE